MRAHRSFYSLYAVVISIMFLLLLAGAVACAQTNGNDGLIGQTLPASVFTNGSLNVVTGPGTNYTFTGPSLSQNLTFKVSNPGDSEIKLYVAVLRHSQWNVIDSLGTIPPGQTKTFEYPVNFSYNGRTNETDLFAVIGQTRSGFVGYAFNIQEDWTQYETSLKSTLSVVGVASAIVLLAILLVVILGVAAVALTSRHVDDVSGTEYTLRTLFFPITRARPLAEKIADILINPFFWVVELIFGALLILLILNFTLKDIRPDIGILVFVIGGVAALFMPIIFLVIAWFADYYEREPLRFLIAMFMWGVAATFIAFFMNTALSLFFEMILGSGLATVAVAVLIAPVVEETAKGLGVLILSGHHEMDNTFDGILFGFAVGMGFAAVENWLYFATNANPVVVGGLTPWAYTILYRSFLCSLAHGCFTATTGGFIGFFRSRKKLRNFAFAGFIIGLPFAIIMHGLFNFTAIIDSIMQSGMGVPVPVFDPLLTLTVTTIYIIIGILLQLRIKRRLMGQGPKPQ